MGSLVNNYRPISVLSNLSKTFEFVAHVGLFHCLELKYRVFNLKADR